MQLASLSLPVDTQGALPTEFRLLKAGENKSLKGTFYFGPAEAESVMLDAAERVDGKYMVDLEHLSLSQENPNYDPDARAWFRAEMRGGELWATDVTWTTDGAERLQSKRQRFISPTFTHDEAGRVIALYNAALTAWPASYQSQELVAASAAGANMDPEKALQTIMKALGMDPALPGKLAVLLGLDATADVEAIKGAMDAYNAKLAKVNELMDAEEAKTEEPKVEDKPAEAPPAAPPAAMSLAGIPGLEGLSAAEQTAKVETWRKAYLSNAAEAKRLADERAELDRQEKRAALVSLAKAIGPGRVWADDKQLSAKPKWERMSVAEIRETASELPAIGLGAAPAATGALSDRELKICKETGCDPAVFAARKASMTAQRGQ